MSQLTPQQIEAIADENGALYQRDIIKTTFKTRTQGFWAGSLLGMVSGIGIGALVGLAGIIAAHIAMGMAFAAASAILAPVVGAFALSGMVMGAVIMTSVNASASAAVGLAKVNDRKQLLNDPNEGLAEAIKYRGTAQDKATLWNTLIPFNKGSKSVFSVRNAIIFGALGLIAGGVLVGFGGPGLLAAAMLPTLHVAAPAATAILANTTVLNTMAFASCGLFGAFFGVDGPTMAANATQFIGDIFGGKKLGFGMRKAPQIELPSPALSAAIQNNITDDDMAKINVKLAAANNKTFAEAVATQSLQPSSAHL